jgi:four helix bundle protein
MRKIIEARLIELAKSVEKTCNKIPKSYFSENLVKQVVRSSSSAALNYGEAQAAESQADFVHKVSIVLKELRETQISLNLLLGSENENQNLQIKQCLNECSQLVAIFHKTVMTARSKSKS